MLLQRGVRYLVIYGGGEGGFVHYYRISKGVRPNPQNPPSYAPGEVQSSNLLQHEAACIATQRTQSACCSIPGSGPLYSTLGRDSLSNPYLEVCVYVMCLGMTCRTFWCCKKKKQYHTLCIRESKKRKHSFLPNL